MIISLLKRTFYVKDFLSEALFGSYVMQNKSSPYFDITDLT